MNTAKKIILLAVTGFFLASQTSWAAVSVRDSSVVNKMRAQTRSLETQTGILEEITATGIGLQNSIGEPQAVSLFTISSKTKLQTLNLGSGWTRMRLQPEIWERLDPPGAEPIDSDQFYIPTAITGTEEDFKNYPSTRNFVLDKMFAYADEDDLAGNVRDARNIHAARDVFFRNLAVDNWALAVQGQHAISDSSESIAAHQGIIEDSTSLRTDTIVTNLLLIELIRSQAAANRLASADLGMRSMQIIIKSPPILGSRRLEALRDFSNADDAPDAN